MSSEIEFNVVPSYPDYEASRCGMIRNRRSPRKSRLTPFMVNKYLSVKICQDGTRQQRRVHRLIAEVYVPNPEGKPFINHRNGNKLDNSVSNLEWCTQQENITHAVESGLFASKKRGHLMPVDVLEVRRLLSLGRRHREVAGMFGVSIQGIGLISRGKTWKHVQLGATPSAQ